MQKAATLTTIFSDVLANLAFMFSDDEPIETPAESAWLETHIGYHGSSAAGQLHLWCTREFGRLLAANLLGVEPDDDDAESATDDAVKEFMNIVCGQVVTALHGTDDVFNLTIPEIKELSEAPLTSPDGAETSTMWVEGHEVQLAYQLGE